MDNAGVLELHFTPDSVYAIIGGASRGDYSGTAGVLVQLHGECLAGLLCGSQIDPECLGQLTEPDGWLKLSLGTWERTAVAALSALPEQEAVSYCAWKSVELLVLLMQPAAAKLRVENGVVRQVRSARAYMEQHLGERLIIDALSRRFQLAPTALKATFRQLYGQPLHRWLRECRLQKAAEALGSTSATVLQIAQSVGFESASQFNTAFRQQYGVLPSAFRKKSETGEKSPIPEDTSTGLKLLTGKDAKNVYSHVTAAGLRAKDCVMKTVTSVQEGAADILATAKEAHTKVEYIVAHGIVSLVNDKRVLIGSAHFVFEDEHCEVPEGSGRALTPSRRSARICILASAACLQR